MRSIMTGNPDSKTGDFEAEASDFARNPDGMGN
jgi:hypothetical protein